MNWENLEKDVERACRPIYDNNMPSHIIEMNRAWIEWPGMKTILLHLIHENRRLNKEVEGVYSRLQKAHEDLGDHGAEVKNLRAFVAVGKEGDIFSAFTLYDFNDAADREGYYDMLDRVESNEEVQVFEFIKRSDSKWYLIGPTEEDKEYADAYRRMLLRGQVPEGRDYPGMPRDSMG